MNVPCPHWSSDAPSCRLGLYGGNPSPGVCLRVCEHGPKLAREQMPKRPPMPIPDDFDVEHERRRTRQGGCCGSPSE